MDTEKQTRQKSGVSKNSVKQTPESPSARKSRKGGDGTGERTSSNFSLKVQETRNYSAVKDTRPSSKLAPFTFRQFKRVISDGKYTIRFTHHLYYIVSR